MEWIESDFTLKSAGDDKWFWDLQLLVNKKGVPVLSSPIHGLPLPIVLRFIASYRANGNTLEEHLKLWKQEMSILIKKCKELKILQ